MSDRIKHLDRCELHLRCANFVSGEKAFTPTVEVQTEISCLICNQFLFLGPRRFITDAEFGSIVLTHYEERHASKKHTERK